MIFHPVMYLREWYNCMSILNDLQLFDDPYANKTILFCKVVFQAYAPFKYHELINHVQNLVKQICVEKLFPSWQGQDLLITLSQGSHLLTWIKFDPIMEK